MQVNVLAGHVLCLLLLPISVAAQSPSAFERSLVVFQTDLPAVHEQAMKQREGDLFVYFYRPGDPLHSKMDSLVFSDERLSRYIMENFGALAANVDTEIGEKILEIFNPGHAYHSPFIAVANKRYSNTLISYGWHNVSPDLDEYGLDSNGQHWLKLVAMKEFGQLPPKPGAEEWGRWSARVVELRSE